MTRKQALMQLLAEECIVGVVRESSAAAARECALIYADHGIRFVEITLTTPDALLLLEKLASTLDPNVILAAGSVRSSNDAAEARRSGAQMIVSPHTNLQIVEYAMEHDLFCVAGAATATEVVRAWEGGADIIKIYPAPMLGGPDYIRTLRQPLPDIPMLAGGPVAVESIDAYLDAGAVAVNLGGSLAQPHLVAAGQWSDIAARVDRAVHTVRVRTGRTDDISQKVH